MGQSAESQPKFPPTSPFGNVGTANNVLQFTEPWAKFPPVSLFGNVGTANSTPQSAEPKSIFPPTSLFGNVGTAHNIPQSTEPEPSLPPNPATKFPVPSDKFTFTSERVLLSVFPAPPSPDISVPSFSFDGPSDHVEKKIEGLLRPQSSPAFFGNGTFAILAKLRDFTILPIGSKDIQDPRFLLQKLDVLYEHMIEHDYATFHGAHYQKCILTDIHGRMYRGFMDLTKMLEEIVHSAARIALHSSQIEAMEVSKELRKQLLAPDTEDLYDVDRMISICRSSLTGDQSLLESTMRRVGELVYLFGRFDLGKTASQIPTKKGSQGKTAGDAASEDLDFKGAWCITLSL